MKMPFRFGKRNKTSILEKNGLNLQWPRLWIKIIGIILIVLCFIIACMEVGNIVSDLRRGTAFGGFIVFLPLLACAILVLVTVFEPRLILRRIAMILCIIVIILCLVLIAYDSVILGDPTRCFVYNCNDATVNASNSTNNITVSGWPLNIVWPSYFQTNMNAKRIVQSIQLFCAVLFIICAVLFVIIYFKYGTAKVDEEKEIRHVDQPVLVTRETSITPVKFLDDSVPSFPQYSLNHFLRPYTVDDPTKPSNETAHSYPQYKHLVRTYTIDGLPAQRHKKAPRKTKRKTYHRSQTDSVSFDRICRRCEKEPRIVLTTKDDRQKYFSHLCANCNNEIAIYHHKPSSSRPTTDHGWKN